MADNLPAPDTLSDPATIQAIIAELDGERRFFEAGKYKVRQAALARAAAAQQRFANAPPEAVQKAIEAAQQRAARVKELNAEVSDAEDKGQWPRASRAKAELLRLAPRPR